VDKSGGLSIIIPINYMCVTASFIDYDWTFHKKILKFNQIPNYRGETIGRMI
jgi:hypothetical protein